MKKECIRVILLYCCSFKKQEKNLKLTNNIAKKTAIKNTAEMQYSTV